jgi:hypothetical protein
VWPENPAIDPKNSTRVLYFGPKCGPSENFVFPLFVLPTMCTSLISHSRNIQTSVCNCNCIRHQTHHDLCNPYTQTRITSFILVQFFFLFFFFFYRSYIACVVRTRMPLLQRGLWLAVRHVTRVRCKPSRLQAVQFR